MKQIIDLTIPLGPETALYPGDPAPRMETISKLEDGDPVTASVLMLGVHAGTHVDLPGHFLPGGRLLGDYDATDFCGPAELIDLTEVEARIEAEDLPALIPENHHLLLKTRNSGFVREQAFRPDYVSLSPEAAAALLKRKPRSIGIDYYSLDPFGDLNFPSHRLCAEAGLPVYVCLDLARMEAGPCQFAGLPLAMPGLEGAPVRAVAWGE